LLNIIGSVGQIAVHDLHVNVRARAPLAAQGLR
jgi:hypothetical protein